MVKVTKAKDPLKEALKKFEKSTKSPVDYLNEQKEHAEQNRLLLKTLFDYAKSSGSHFQSNSLPDELFIEQMDEEQIWQQLEMQNDSFWNKCMTETCRLLALNEKSLHLDVKFAEDDQLDDENVEDEEDLGEKGEEGESDDLDENESGDEDVDEEEDESDGEKQALASNSESENENGEQIEKVAKIQNGKSVVDDKFFNLSEMNAFLDNEDKKELDRLNSKGKRNRKEESSDDEEEIDYFDSLSTDSEDDESDGANEKENGPMFSDFFNDDEKPMVETREQIRERRRLEREAKNKRKSQEMKADLGMEDSEGSENESDDEINEDSEKYYEQDESDEEEDVGEKSEFDLRQERLKSRIEQLENDALEDKPWQLKGEITSATRPKNSLLEEVLEFDSTARPAPLVTEETTLCLEDLIKKRIKSKIWDDVERKIKPLNENQDFRKTLVLNQEKSKESLAQVYEKDYLEKVHKLNNVEDSAKPDEPAEHTEIRKAIKDLFIKLDALSNFHFTSKPVAAEAKIITNIPAIEMEEVAPVGVSDGNLLAPEEVKQRPVGDEIGKSERSNTDKNRERRKKKIKQKILKNLQDKRIEEKEKLGIKVTSKEKQQQLMKQVTKSRNVIKGKNTDNDESRALKSSKNFFTQLQDNTTATVKSKSLGKKKSRTDLLQNESNAKRFKL